MQSGHLRVFGFIGICRTVPCLPQSWAESFRFFSFWYLRASRSRCDLYIRAVSLSVILQTPFALSRYSRIRLFINAQARTRLSFASRPTSLRAVPALGSSITVSRSRHHFVAYEDPDPPSNLSLMALTCSFGERFRRPI